MNSEDIPNPQQSKLAQLCKEEPVKCKKLLAFMLIKLLATTPLSYRLPWTIDYSGTVPWAPYTKPKTTPPVGEWHSYFDDTCWTPMWGWWNPTFERWETDWYELLLYDIGTWANGYRPSIIRISGTQTNGGILVLRNNDGEIMNQNPYTPYVLGSEETLIFESEAPGKDIKSLNIYQVDTLYVDNIEFFVP